MRRKREDEKRKPRTKGNIVSLVKLSLNPFASKSVYGKTLRKKVLGGEKKKK